MGMFGSIFERGRAAVNAAMGGLRTAGPTKSDAARLSRANAVAARMFMSADTSRLSGDWPTTPVPFDWIVTRFQRTLVARSREQANNNDLMKAFLRLQRTNIVGPHGITFHSQVVTRAGKPDKRARKAIETWWKKWGKRDNCDVAGNLSWQAMERLQLETKARDGESFTRIVTGADAPMGFALQVIDPQRCPVDYNVNDLPNGHFIRHGIKFNRYGKVVSYFFALEAERNRDAQSYDGRRFEEVPAEQIIHDFTVEAPGQKRGMPWAATGLYRAKQVSAGEDAAVVNMRMGAAKMGFVSFEDGHGPEYDDKDGEDPMTIDAEPGAFVVLPQGAKFDKFDPTYPQGELIPFVKLMHRSFAGGAGVAYHALTQDLTDVNFSSIRQGELDSRESYKERQEQFVEGFHERVFSAAFARALLAGHVVDEAGKPLPATKLADYSAHLWQPRRWSWIDPRADVEANESSKNNLLASPSALIREEGRDPAAVWAETAADIAAMREAGIPDEFIQLSFGRKPDPQPKPAPESKA